MQRNRIIIRAIIFSFLFLSIFAVTEKLFFNNSGSSDSWIDIQDESTTAPEVLFMGNSRVYRTINPHIITQALGIKTEILGSASQNAAITLENLKIVLEYKKPKVIVLEAFALCTDNMEELIAERGYIIKNFDGVDNWRKKGKALSKFFELDYMPEGMFQLFRPTLSWTRWEDLKTKYSNGTEKELSYGYDGIDWLSDVEFDENHVQRQEEYYQMCTPGKLSTYNEEALEEILKITQEEGIELYIYNAPVAANVKKTAGLCLRIEEILEGYEHAHWLGDWNLYTDDIGINKYDFADEGHFNRKGSVKNTVYMIEILEKILGIKADYGSVFEYQSESIVPLRTGGYRYSMYNFHPDTEYSFRLYEDGEVVTETEKSALNYIDLPELLKENQELHVFMSLPEGIVKEIRLPFMREADTKETMVIYD